MRKWQNNLFTQKDVNTYYIYTVTTLFQHQILHRKDFNSFWNSLDKNPYTTIFKVAFKAKQKWLM